MAGWHPNHQCVIGDILVHHGSCPNECISSDVHPADHGAVCAQRGPLTHKRVSILAHAGNCGAWVVDVGEDHARTTKNPIFQGDIVINRDVVLNLAVVSDHHTIAYENILTKRTALDIPITAPAQTWLKCQTLVLSPMDAPSSMMALSWHHHVAGLFIRMPSILKDLDRLGFQVLKGFSLQSNHCFILWSTPTFAAPTSQVLLLIQALCRHLALFRSSVTVAIRGHRLLPAQVEGQSP